MHKYQDQCFTTVFFKNIEISTDIGETNIEVRWFMIQLSTLLKKKYIFVGKSWNEKLSDEVNEAIISPDHSRLSVTQWASPWPAPVSLLHFSSRLF